MLQLAKASLDRRANVMQESYANDLQFLLIEEECFIRVSLIDQFLFGLVSAPH